MQFAVHDRSKESATVCRENGDGTCWPILESCGNHKTPGLMADIDALVDRANSFDALKAACEMIDLDDKETVFVIGTDAADSLRAALKLAKGE